ncbi:MAG: anaerobic glycerol-3-phosphate dehydrogenase subunit C [Bacteroidales bacterium]|nr:anaerobic glycerol-3-phosphate dehydrogenase subunit C [Bacteroidales bacterium]
MKNRSDFEQCVKCSVCNAWCPVMKVTPLFIGPKKAGPDGARLRVINPAFYTKGLDMCLNCKQCEVACPSGVNISSLIQNARREGSRDRKKQFRDELLACTDLTGSMVRPVAPLANAILGTKMARGFLESALGIDHRRVMPQYSSQSFTQWFRSDQEDRQRFYPHQVYYFHGCYVNYNYPELGMDLIKVLNAIGIGVQLIDGERCCGVPLIGAGKLDKARREAEGNVARMSGLNTAILTTSSTCALTLRDEYPDLLGVDNSRMRSKVMLATRYIYEMLPKMKKQIRFSSSRKVRAAYHCPCHQDKLGWSFFTIELMKMVSGLELVELDRNCCGIAGTYGFKKENYETSQMIGEPLFRQIRELRPDFVICECETCKWQIEMSTGVKVLNPISVLAEALR